MGEIKGSTVNETWWIDSPCTREEAPDEPCEIEQMVSDGMATPHIWCALHGQIIGHVVWPASADA